MLLRIFFFIYYLVSRGGIVRISFQNRLINDSGFNERIANESKFLPGFYTLGYHPVASYANAGFYRPRSYFAAVIYYICHIHTLHLIDRLLRCQNSVWY